jgi:hypothetical protein
MIAHDDALVPALTHLTVSVAAADDIVRSKEASGREKDRAAVPSMRRDFGLDAAILRRR